MIYSTQIRYSLNYMGWIFYRREGRYDFAIVFNEKRMKQRMDFHRQFRKALRRRAMTHRLRPTPTTKTMRKGRR